MTIDFARYDRLVHRIYDAARDPQHWSGVLAELTDICGGICSLLLTPLHTPEQGGLVFPHNVSQATLDRWATKSIGDDPYLHIMASRNLFRVGAAFNGADLMPHEAFRDTDFFREFFTPSHMARVSFGVVFDDSAAHAHPTMVSVFRRECDSPFEPHDVELIRKLLPHMSRSLGGMFHLRDRRFRTASTLAALDRLPVGVVLLDALGGVRFTNRGAQRQLQSATTVLLKNQASSASPRLGLARHLHHLEQAFQQALQAAISRSTVPDGQGFSRALLLPDAQGKATCVLHAAPLSRAHELALGDGSPRVMVFLCDLAAVTVPAELLTELFGLTLGEARAALQVLQGGSNDAMAHRLGISANTFKSQLKAVFAKTGTHRQSDLLRLLLALGS